MSETAEPLKTKNKAKPQIAKKQKDQDEEMEGNPAAKSYFQCNFAECHPSKHDS